MHVLRFEATLVSTEPDDETRKFIISFYCGDDTIQIYEICDKNSGRIGGRFMERKKQTNPVTGRYYQEKEFVLGEVVYLVGFKFMLAKGRKNVTYQAVPSYNGYGSPEDSLGSVYSLNPKAPKVDMKKMFK